MGSIMDNFNNSNSGSENLDEPIPFDKDPDKPIPFDDDDEDIKAGVSHSPLSLGGGGTVKMPTDEPAAQLLKPVVGHYAAGVGMDAVTLVVICRVAGYRAAPLSIDACALVLVGSVLGQCAAIVSIDAVAPVPGSGATLDQMAIASQENTFAPIRYHLDIDETVPFAVAGFIDTIGAKAPYSPITDLHIAAPIHVDAVVVLGTRTD